MRRIFSIAYYECLAILRTPILLIMVVFTPVLYGCIFGAVYFHPIITNIPTAIVDQDHSDLSRQIADAYRHSPAFAVREDITEYSDLEAAMRDGRIRAGIIIEKDLQNRVEKHEACKVLAVYDASNLVWGYNIRKNVRTVVSEFNTWWVTQKVGEMGFDRYEQEQLISPLSYNVEVWYNPTYSYANFMLYGLFLMILHQIGLMSVALSIPREREKNTWIHFQTAGITRGAIMAGKCLPYFMIFMLQYLLLLIFGVKFFHLAYYGTSTFWLLAFGVLYVTLLLFIGYTISYWLPNSLQATRFIMLVSVPFIMMSGMIWPPTHIPKGLNWLASLLPFTHAQKFIRIFAQKNGGWEQFGDCILVLCGMLAVTVAIFLLFCHRRESVPEKDGRYLNWGREYPHRNK